MALAGFAGIIATFQFAGLKNVKRVELVGLGIIIITALTETFASILPLVLLTYGIKESIVWGFCSGTLAILATMHLFDATKSIWGKVKKKSLIVYYGFLQAIIGLAIIFLVLNAMNVGFHREPGPYITAIFSGMILSGLLFARMLLTPLWRTLRQQESSDGGPAGPH